MPTLEKESAIEEANESIEESQENKAAVPDNEIQSTVIDADASHQKKTKPVQQWMQTCLKARKLL
ncbi:hypothetical protein [Carnobacterium antarcticum]|uniref:hypothetical protein n=1 Tax=Carnobacterium sp. CP1 TaxID=1564681 RepID=UPI00073A61FB|nr:hypothetical protein [Carnobacterium sp. CP1]ALV20652.1 Cell division protein FtsK [Carnobacterium sp. CP1]